MFGQPEKPSDRVGVGICEKQGVSFHLIVLEGVAGFPSVRSGKTLGLSATSGRLYTWQPKGAD